MAYHPRGLDIFVFGVSFICLLVSTGCTLFESAGSKNKNITRGFKGWDKGIKKLVAIAPFDNRTDYADQNLESNFIETFVENTESSCPRLHILHPAREGYPAFLNDLPKQGDGRVDNLKLANQGRRCGLNSIVSVALAGINGLDRKKGFWWFKDTHYYFRIQMKAEMYDTETGTKLFDEIIGRDIEVEEFDIELFRSQNRVDLFQIEEAFEYFADTIAEKVCDAMVVQPWKGYILSVNGEKTILSSGEISGLTSGQLLEVFDSSEIIKGVDGHHFSMPGPKTGELEITSVSNDRAEAVIKAGSGIRAGNVVKLKD